MNKVKVQKKQVSDAGNNFSWRVTTFDMVTKEYSKLSKNRPLSFLTLLDNAYTNVCNFFISDYMGHHAKMTKDLIKDVPLFFLISPTNPLLRSPITGE